MNKNCIARSPYQGQAAIAGGRITFPYLVSQITGSIANRSRDGLDILPSTLGSVGVDAIEREFGGIADSAIGLSPESLVVVKLNALLITQSSTQYTIYAINFSEKTLGGHLNSHFPLDQGAYNCFRYMK